ncbi:MAG: YajQ family cyclic di-GMP-binding protein [Pseudomonadota bacterium]
MPSFDIVNKTDLQQVDNAINSVRREYSNRYDFKNSNCTIEQEQSDLTIVADDDYKLGQIQDMLKVHFTRQNIDPKVLLFNDEEKASGNMVRQKVVIQQGIEKEIASKIVKFIKATKMKVQSSIRGEEVRVEGKKRDDLQQIMNLLKAEDYGIPLQFINFRD